MQQQNSNIFFILLIVVALCASCSLDYSDERPTQVAPELVLHNVAFSRIERGDLALRMSAQEIESYRADNTFYAKDVLFQGFDNGGDTVSSGSANFLLADQKNELYALLGNVSLSSVAFNALITATNLRLDNKTDQLSSSQDDEVSLTLGNLNQEKNNSTEQVFVIKGSGFFANTRQQEFSFDKYVSGSIVETNDEDSATIAHLPAGALVEDLKKNDN